MNRKQRRTSKIANAKPWFFSKCGHCAALQLQVITEITRFLKSTPFPSNFCHYSALWMLDGCAIGANWEGKEGKGCIVLDLIWHDDDNVPDADDPRYDTYRQVLDVVESIITSANEANVPADAYASAHLN